MITLIAREVVYWSQGDEDSFFSWLDRIGCVAGVKGVGVELYISIRDGALDNEDLRELIALFHRYGVDKKQLHQFENSQNTSWFRDDKKFWYHDVFGG